MIQNYEGKCLPTYIKDDWSSLNDVVDFAESEGLTVSAVSNSKRTVYTHQGFTISMSGWVTRKG